MSKSVSALNGVHFRGIADIKELALQGMITVRGDLAKAKVKSAVKSVSGLNIPKTAEIAMGDGASVAWMSPDELLLLGEYAQVEDSVAKLQSALAKEHALVVNVSDARAVFSVSGSHARAVMAKLAPVDLAPDAFTPGMFRRTRLAQVPAAFWMTEDDSFQIICFRSVAQYVFDLLCVAAQDGSEVGVF